MTYSACLNSHESTSITLNFSLAVHLPASWAAKASDLVSDADRLPSPTGEQSARALLALILGVGEIETISLALLPETRAELDESFRPAPLREWTLDTSKPSFMGFDDGTSMEIPPRLEGTL